MSIDAPNSSRPVQGYVCPACAHGDSISEETTTRPLDAGDVAGAWLFGIWGFLFAVTGRKSKRLRCARCNCRFPKPGGLFVKGLVWLLITTIVTSFVAIMASFGSSPTPGSSAFLDTIAVWCRAGAANPTVALAVVCTPIVILIITFLFAAVNRKAERVHLWNAVSKRDATETQAGSAAAV